MALSNAHQILTAIVGKLMEAEYRRLQDWLNMLVKQNQEEQRLEQPIGFIYNGVYYRPDWQGKGQFRKPALAHSLWKDMDSYLLDKHIIDMDAQMIRQVLFGLIMPCESDQDIRDALPESLAAKFEIYKAMPRTREEAWTIRDNPKKLAHYEETLPRIKMYLMSVMFF